MIDEDSNRWQWSMGQQSLTIIDGGSNDRWWQQWLMRQKSLAIVDGSSNGWQSSTIAVMDDKWAAIDGNRWQSSMKTAIVGNRRWSNRRWRQQSMTIVQQWYCLCGQQSWMMTAIVDETEMVDNHWWEQWSMAIVDNSSNHWQSSMWVAIVDGIVIIENAAII